MTMLQIILLAAGFIWRIAAVGFAVVGLRGEDWLVAMRDARTYSYYSAAGLSGGLAVGLFVWMRLSPLTTG